MPNSSYTVKSIRAVALAVLQSNTGLRGTFGLALGKADVIYASAATGNAAPLRRIRASPIRT